METLQKLLLTKSGADKNLLQAEESAFFKALNTIRDRADSKVQSNAFIKLPYAVTGIEYKANLSQKEKVTRVLYVRMKPHQDEYSFMADSDGFIQT